jgi:hypothetical protein
MRILLSLVVAMALQAADAKTPKPAVPKEPVAEAVEHAGDICKATGGFGRVFGRGPGHVDATAADDWAPFEKLTIETGTITAVAPFRGSGETLEDDVAHAERFLKALDKAVTAKQHFKHREASGNAVRFTSGKEAGSGVTLQLRQEEDQIVAICAGG